MVRRSFLGLLMGGLLLASLPLLAQDEAPIADGLNNPRQMFYAEDGTLYIAEAGYGGEDEATSVFGQPISVGPTASITTVTPDGEQSVLLDGLGSTQGFGNIIGAHAIYVDETTYWVVMGEGPQAGSYDESLIFDALVGFSRESMEAEQVISLRETAQPNNPEAANFSNPVDIAVADGVVYIADAGCNCIQSWTPDDGVQLAATWTPDDNPVPTAVAFGPDGDLYVGFLGGFPWGEGATRIERWSGGELAETYTGLTTVTDILVAEDGTLYAVEHGLTGEGYVPGRVVTVTSDGITPVMEGLESPYGLALSPDGQLVVSVGSVAGEGAGRVIAVTDMGGDMEDMEEPAATEEAGG